MQEKTVEKKQGGEEYALEAVPEHARRHWLDMTFVWFGAAMVSQLYVAGVGLSIGMGGLKPALLAVLLGALFLAMFAGLNGYVGAITHCNAALTGRYAYGSVGQAIPGFHIADIGWYCVITAIFSNILAYAIPGIDARVWCILISLLYVTNNYVGFNKMIVLNKVAFPVLVLTSLYGIYRVHVTLPGGFADVWNKEYEVTTTLASGVLAVIGTWSSGASRAADYMRFAKKPSDSFLATFVGFFTGFCLCIVVGCVFGAATGVTEVGQTLVMLGMVAPGVLMFFIQNWTTNEHASYVTSTALPVTYYVVTGGKELPRRFVVLLTAFISLIISGMDLQNYYVPFISFLGFLIPCIGGVVIGDYFIMSKTKYHWSGHKNFYKMDVNDEDVIHHKFNFATIPALIFGLLFGWKTTFFVPAVNGFVATIIVLCIFEMIFYACGLQKKEVKLNEEYAKGVRS